VFKVFPANNLPVGGKSENGGKNGGYIVVIYGSNTPNGIDAIMPSAALRYNSSSAPSIAKRTCWTNPRRMSPKAIMAFYEAYQKNLRVRSENQGRGEIIAVDCKTSWVDRGV
jgi:hypothetical protein